MFPIQQFRLLEPIANIYICGLSLTLLHSNLRSLLNRIQLPSVPFFIALTTMLFSPIIALTALMAGGPALADVSLDRSIQLRGTHFCLDNTDGVLEDGNRLQIYDCWGEDKDQKWVWEQVEVWNDIPLYHIRLDGTDKCVAFKRPSMYH